ncbi:hypothetical protein SLA2020_339990 [Shorea laevis]
MASIPTILITTLFLLLPTTLSSTTSAPTFPSTASRMSRSGSRFILVNQGFILFTSTASRLRHLDSPSRPRPLRNNLRPPS